MIIGLEFATKIYEDMCSSVYYYTHYYTYTSPRIFHIQIPILLRYKIKLNKKRNLILKDGPYFSYALFNSSAVRDDYRRTEAGFQLGMDLDFPQFTLGVEITRSFIKQNPTKRHNETYTLVFGYKI